MNFFKILYAEREPICAPCIKRHDRFGFFHSHSGACIFTGSWCATGVQACRRANSSQSRLAGDVDYSPISSVRAAHN